MTTARFPVTGTLDGAGGRRRGTVTIDRETGDVVVRPLRSHRTYMMPLASVATWICVTNIEHELYEKKRAKKRGRP
jgi:hypothetical protein